jgi:hypothetical protein
MNLIVVHERRDALTLPGDFASPSVPLTGLNWERELAVIIDMGEQRTAGYRVEVTGINLAGGDELHLDLKVVRPGPGDMVAQVMTHPYAVARIPRIGLRPGTITVTARDQTGAEVVRQVVDL